MYVPQNQAVYLAAFTGALAGMGVAGRALQSAVPLDYEALTQTAGAFAEAFDTTWGLTVTSSLDLEALSATSEALWSERRPPTTGATFFLPATYLPEANVISALLLASGAYFTAQGISPNLPPPSGSGAVIFDGGAPSKNARTDRTAGTQAFTLNTKQGITNLGSGTGAPGTGVLADFGTLAGGNGCTVSGFGATCSGGEGNTAGGPDATVGGGNSNITSNSFATIGGGSGNDNRGNASTIAGGEANLCAGDRGTIGGGHLNVVPLGSTACTVGGGESNTADTTHATVAGGQHNTASDSFGFVGGGEANTASGVCAAVPGGRNNIAAGTYAISNGAGTEALRVGQRALASNSEIAVPGMRQTSSLVLSGSTPGALPGETAEMQFGDTSALQNFLLENGKAYAVEVLASVTKSGDLTVSTLLARKASAFCTGGVVTVTGESVTENVGAAAAATWTLDFVAGVGAQLSIEIGTGITTTAIVAAAELRFVETLLTF